MTRIEDVPHGALFIVQKPTTGPNSGLVYQRVKLRRASGQSITLCLLVLAIELVHDQRHDRIRFTAENGTTYTVLDPQTECVLLVLDPNTTVFQPVAYPSIH